MKINEIIDVKEGNTYIQKIYSTSRYICISLRSMGATRFLYFGRGNGYEGIWLSELRPESFLRKQDAFLEYIRKMLGGAIFDGIEVDEKDRVLSIKYLKHRNRNYFNLFYGGRNLYFSNYFYSERQKDQKLFLSWQNKLFDKEDSLLSYFDEVGRREIGKKESPLREISSMDSLLTDEREKAQINKGLKKKQKFQNRKIDKIQTDIETVSKWKDMQLEVEKYENLEDLHFKVEICGFKINFREKTHFKRRDEVYQKIKKLKKAEVFLNKRLLETKNLKQEVSSDENNLSMIKPVWRVNKVGTKSKKDEHSDSFKIFSFNGYDLGVGLSTQGNDLLRSQWAKKEDIWLHLEGDKSAHVVIKFKEAMSIDEEIFPLVGGVLVEFSKLSYNEVNLIYTKVKNLKGVKGSSGKVIYKKEKHIKTKILSNWRDSMLTS